MGPIYSQRQLLTMVKLNKVNYVVDQAV